MLEIKRLFIVTGEISGDFLGSSFIKGLKNESNFPIEIKGIVGSKMEEMGVSSIFPISDLNIMGVGEIIPYLPRFILRFYQVFFLLKNGNLI